MMKEAVAMLEHRFFQLARLRETRSTSAYLHWPLPITGSNLGYGQLVVVGEVVSGILFLIAATPLLISRIATYGGP
jgi:hypothetical protein